MAITILNPARFNDDGGVGGRQFIRAAFFDEGYGVSTSFLAYRQGGGIVPATAAFDIIGAGTAGDPLRMSQFSGFVVPAIFTAGSTTFTANGSFTVPSGYTTLTIEAWGAGGQGSGDGALATQQGPGGNGSASVVSGAGLTLMSAGGGSGGGQASTLGAGGAAGTAFGGTTTNTTGQAGTSGGSTTTGTGGTAPSGSVAGGAGGAAVASNQAYLSPPNVGNPGSAPGGGGSGGSEFRAQPGMCGGQFYSSGGGGGSGAYSKTITTSIAAGTSLSVIVGIGGIYVTSSTAAWGGAGANGIVKFTYA